MISSYTAKAYWLWIRWQIHRENAANYRPWPTDRLTLGSTGTVTPATGGIIDITGTWTLTPPVRLLSFGNPQGHLTFTDSTGTVLFEADFLTINLDNLQAMQPWTSNLGTPISGDLIKQTP